MMRWCSVRDSAEQAAGEYIDAHGDYAEVGTATTQLDLVFAVGRWGTLARHCLDASVQHRVVVEDLRGE